MINGRKRKQTIFSLQDGANHITGSENLVKHPIEFYQVCRGFIKQDIIVLFKDFSERHLAIKRINYGIITLLHKVKDALKI
jgi:hypothetical protein